MSNILQLKIKLEGSQKPPIWRQVLVESDINFQQLHAIIQGVMGWDNAHLHQFRDQRRNFSIGIPFDDDFSETEDGRKITINKFLAKEGDSLIYEYDFGDGWEHSVGVQKLLLQTEGQNYPFLLKGKGACPPEDCGGIWGYYHMAEVINNPDHDEHESMVEWTGKKHWDVHAFDFDAAKERLATYFAAAAQFYG